MSTGVHVYPDPNGRHPKFQSAPDRHAVAVTPLDATTIPLTDSLYIGVSGDVVVTLESDALVTYKSVPVGRLHVACKKVMTATTATNILACYVNL